MISLLALFLPLLAAAPPTAAAANDDPLVDVAAQIPDAVLDLRYATADNFLHRAVYPKDARCLLRRSVAQALGQAAEDLRGRGFRLRLYDCFRPRAVQVQMWALFPHKGYVADPKYGSNHNRGAAVDLSLVTLDGHDVEMPSPFDTFGPTAHHGYAGASPQATAHRELLRQVMEAHGFRRIKMEWWHYEWPPATHAPILDQPLSGKDGLAPPNPADVARHQ